MKKSEEKSTQEAFNDLDKAFKLFIESAIGKQIMYAMERVQNLVIRSQHKLKK